MSEAGAFSTSACSSKGMVKCTARTQVEDGKFHVDIDVVVVQ